MFTFVNKSFDVKHLKHLKINNIMHTSSARTRSLLFDLMFFYNIFKRVDITKSTTIQCNMRQVA